jgi:tetratricopeptide (TPR) repeat protein
MRSAALRAAAIAGTLAAFALTSASAFSASETSYVPPKLTQKGTATSAIAGNGVVKLQVLVRADGSFEVQKVVSSTNHGDDAAALEIAKSSRYAPARKNGKKVTAFYTYTLNFVGSQAQASDVAGPLSRYAADVRAGRYADAKAGLTVYLAAHPDDVQAGTLLGVADFFLNDYSGSAAAFTKAGTVPPEYKTIAANAYVKSAEQALASKDAAAAVADATKASRLAPGAPTLNLLGNAQIIAGDYPGAVRSLEQARTLASSEPALGAKQRATISANLAVAYIDAGDVDKAVALLPEIKQLDPDNAVALSNVVSYYAKKGEAAEKSGDIHGAAALYEKAASLGSEYAPLMYTKEAFAYMQGVKPDWKAAQTAAGKALAIKPDDAQANLAEGVALANDGRGKEAVPYLQKADASAKASGDSALATKAEQLLSQLSANR